jgi:carboxypeptidase PM20D1
MQRCSPEQAARLARAIGFRTVTVTARDPSTDPALPPLLAFWDSLRSEFPLTARHLHWEAIGELALLLTWEPGRGEMTAVHSAPQAPAILLYAHADVVPAGDESAWSHGPFAGDIADGFIWGRGALDDKNALLGGLEAVEGLLAEGFTPARAVYLAFGADEETDGERGARAIARALSERRVRLACVFDESSIISNGSIAFIKKPIAMIGVAEKGFANVEIIVRGKPGHAAMPGRHTAAGALCAVVAALERRPFPLRLTGTVERFFRSLAPHARGPLGLALRFLRPLWPLLGGALAADPAVATLFRTTQAVTILRAGEKANVIPGEARAVLNLRTLPGDTAESALMRVDRLARRHLPRGFTIETGFFSAARASDPVPEKPLSAELWQAVSEAVAEIAPDAIVAPFMAIMLSDSRKFVAIADAIVRLLPVVLDPGEVARIHGVDERISFENYGRMVAFYRSVIRKTASRRDG